MAVSKDRSVVSDGIAVARKALETTDILVNNAGTFGARAFADVDFAFYAAPLNTNVWGTIQVTQAALGLVPERGGRIVNLSSQRAYSPKDGTVTVNAVAPAVTRTDMTTGIPQAKRELLANTTPLRRLAEPSDIARVVAFLATDDAGWMTGRTILADGGIAGA